jgi:NH3-dependent NAD+ synthetase
MDKRLTTLIAWLRKSTRRSGGILVPVSGGSDSALIFWLFNQACPEKTLGVFVGKNLRCREWFESVGTVRQLSAPRSNEDKEARRWATFASIAIAENRWLVGSRNRSEQVMGNFSLSSRIATFLPLAGVWKSDVMELCKLAGVPTAVTDSSRRADPDCGRPQELAEIPLELIDVFLKAKTGKAPKKTMNSLTAAQRKYLNGVYTVNQFRRHLPVVGPEIGSAT